MDELDQLQAALDRAVKEPTPAPAEAVEPTPAPRRAPFVIEREPDPLTPEQHRRNQEGMRKALDYYREAGDQPFRASHPDTWIGGIPFAGTAYQVARAYDVNQSSRRVEDGTATDSDYYKVAREIARSEHASRTGKGETLARSLPGAAGFAGEIALTGGVMGLTKLGVTAGALRYLSPLAAKSLGVGAGVAALTAANPGAYLPQGIEQNTRAGREALDPRGLARGFGRGVAQMAVLHGAGQAGQALLPGAGVAPALGRIGLQATTGATGVADVPAGVLGLDTGYGPLADFLTARDEKGRDDALKHAIVGAVHFAAFGAAHEAATGGQGRPAVNMENVASFLRSMRQRGLSRDAAAEALNTYLEPFTPEGIAQEVARQLNNQWPQVWREGASPLEDPTGAVPGHEGPGMPREAPVEAPGAPPTAPEPQTSPEAARGPLNAPTPPQEPAKATTPAGLVDVRGEIEKAGGDSNAATEQLRGRMREHLERGGSVSLWFDGKEVPVASVEGNAVRDAKGQPWGLLPLAMGREGTRNGVEFKPTPEGQPADAEALRRQQGVARDLRAQLRAQGLATKRLSDGQVMQKAREKGLQPSPLEGVPKEDVAALAASLGLSEKAFRKSAETDPHVQQLLDHYREQQGGTPSGPKVIPPEPRPEETAPEPMRGVFKEEPAEPTPPKGEGPVPLTPRPAGERLGRLWDRKQEQREALLGVDDFAAADALERRWRDWSARQEAPDPAKVGWYERQGLPHAEAVERARENQRSVEELKAKNPMRGVFKEEARQPRPEEPAARLPVAELHQRLVEGEAVPGLTPAQAADLRAHLGGESFREIGRRRGVSGQAVADSVERALESLHDRVEEPPAREERGVLEPSEADVRVAQEELHQSVKELEDRALGLKVKQRAPRTPYEVEQKKLAKLAREMLKMEKGGTLNDEVMNEIGKRADAIHGETLRANAGEGAAEGPAEARGPAGGLPEAEGPGAPAGGPGPRGSPAGDVTAQIGKLARGIAGLGGGQSLGIVPPGVARGVELAQHLAGTYHFLADGVKRLAQQSFPTATRLDRETGESLARLGAAQTWAREAAPHYGDLVVGPDADPAFDRRVGTAYNEIRLRYMKDAYLKRAREASGDADRARAAGDQPAAAALSREASDALNARANVKSMVGPDSDFETEADFQDAAADPAVRAALARHRSEFALAVTEPLFRSAQGIDEVDPISSFTQNPDHPMSLVARAPGEGGTPTSGGGGNFKNLGIRRSVFADQARGDAPAYETSMRKIIEEVLTRAAVAGKKAEFYRTAHENGVVRWGPPGHPEAGEAEIPYSRPPKDTQQSEPGDVAYVPKEMREEVVRALKVVPTAEWVKATGSLMHLPTIASLASSVEAATHGLNLAKSVLAPGLHFGDLAGNALAKLRGDPALRQKVVDLAEMGAQKPRGPESGLILPEKWKKADPTYWTHKLLDGLNDVMRATLSDAHDRLVEKGHFPDTETHKRDFLNAWLGNYEKSAQSGVVAFLRESKIGPFATAATTMTANSVRSVLGSPMAPATSAASAALLRAGQLAKFAAVQTGVAAVNYLLWGRVDGDENTPLGSIKLADDPQTGRARSLNVMALTGIPRALNALGILPYVESKRQGTSEAGVEDQQVGRVVHALAHPFLGPGVSFAWTALTGKNTLGRSVAAEPPEGGSHARENLKAALRTANPLEAALTGADEPGRDVPWGERLAKLAGPLGVKYHDSTPPVARNVKAELAEAEEAYRRRAVAAKRMGLREPVLPSLQLLRRAAQALNDLDRGFNQPGASAERRQELRQKQAEVGQKVMGALQRVRAAEKQALAGRGTTRTSGTSPQ